MIVVVSDTSKRNAIRKFFGKVEFFFKGRKYEITKRYHMKACNVLDITRMDELIAELSWHDCNKTGFKLQVRSIDKNVVMPEDFLWECVDEALKYSGYRSLERNGEDPEWDYRLTVSIKEPVGAKA